MHSQFYRCFDPGGGGGGGRDARFRLLLSSLLLCSDPTLSILQNGSIPPSIFSIAWIVESNRALDRRPRSEFLEARRCRGKMSRRRCRLSKAIEIASSYGRLVKSRTARRSVYYIYMCVYAHVEVKFLISNDSDRSRVRFSSGETRPIGGREIGKNWGESCGIGKESVARIDELFEGRFYNALPTHFSSAKLVPAYPVEGEMGRTVGRREH